MFTLEPATLAKIVAVGGFGMIASLIESRFLLFPIFLAMVFPSNPVEAAGVGMVLCFLMGGLTSLIKGAR